VLRGARLAVEIDRHLRVLEAHFADELAQIEHGRIEVGPFGELLVVDRQDEGAGAALLLRELREVAVAGRPQHLEALLLDRRGERADAEPRRVLGAVVLVDDDDRKLELQHRRPSARREKARSVGPRTRV
jgi:hypothetical protein